MISFSFLPIGALRALESHPKGVQPASIKTFGIVKILLQDGFRGSMFVGYFHSHGSLQRVFPSGFPADPPSLEKSQLFQ
jgi:hypothetical protein